MPANTLFRWKVWYIAKRSNCRRLAEKDVDKPKFYRLPVPSSRKRRVRDPHEGLFKAALEQDLAVP